MNLFLLGYRCAGKTVVGRELARRLAWTFADADDLLERRSGRSVADLVADKGWEAFRDREGTLLGELCRGRDQVVATGGGAILRSGNVAAMRAAGVTVWLRVGVETVRRRMAADPRSAGMRPALEGDDPVAEAAEVLRKRAPLYALAADVTVDAETGSVAQVADRILTACRGRLGLERTP